jgi:excisionase family DNA binding protein
MAYAQHRSDLISARLGPGGALTLFRAISGLRWVRRVPLDDYLTPMEAAVVLNVHRVTVYDWIAKGLVQSYQGAEGETWLRWGEVYQFGRTRGLLR